MTENPYQVDHAAETVGDRTSPKRTSWGCLLLVVAIFVVLLGLVIPATRRSAPEAARRMHCSNSLKQICLALHNYEAEYHALPPAYTLDVTGQPLHSWRTLILPYIEQKALYDSIDLSKPWNDPVNATAYATDIPIYRCPSSNDLARSHTSYLAIVCEGSCLQAGQPRALEDIKDGTSNTLVVIEVVAEQAVHWMSPVDADGTDFVDMGSQASFNHTGGINVGFADGSINFISSEATTDAVRRSLITIAGGEDVSIN